MINLKLFPGYVIDTSAIIDLWRRYYPIDIFKSLWQEIDRLIKNDELISPREVFEEIKVGDDELFSWIKNQKKMFKELDNIQLLQVKKILIKFPNWIDPNKAIPEADPFIIALALAVGWTVITSEKYSTGSKPKIPDVCKSFNIKCINLIDFFREKKWSF